MSRVTIKKDNLPALLRGFKALTDKEVLVGVPDSTTNRDKDEAAGPATNATLAYSHDNGSPAQNIPARPFMKPGIAAIEQKASRRFKAAAEAALKGNTGAVEKELSAVGLMAQDAIKQKIGEGPFEPLSEATLRARARRGRQGAIQELENRRQGLPPDASNARPLIDTGQMRNSVTYVIREKK